MTKARRIAPTLVPALAAIPLSAVATVLGHGFWRWFEEATGIEAYGHAGPAGWCYAAGYAILVAAVAAVAALRGATGGRGRQS